MDIQYNLQLERIIFNEEYNIGTKKDKRVRYIKKKDQYVHIKRIDKSQWLWG